MFRTLIKVGLLLVAGILVYNYFFGTNEEQENAKKVFGQFRGVVVSVGQLLKSENEKFNAGKYDAALDKLGGVYRAIRTQARHLDEKVVKRLDELENRKATLENELNEIEANDLENSSPALKKKDPKVEKERAAKQAEQARRKEELLKELEMLVKDSDSLLQEASQ
ncbi:MAG TPA: hypothetical protein VK168_19135 [Saprospiraceae bacterium]|nr:hypothetical protein [Saprospiraceae bacterium]